MREVGKEGWEGRGGGRCGWGGVCCRQNACHCHTPGREAWWGSAGRQAGVQCSRQNSPADSKHKAQARGGRVVGCGGGGGRVAVCLSSLFNLSQPQSHI